MKVRRLTPLGAGMLLLAAAAAAPVALQWQWIAANGFAGPAVLALCGLGGLAALVLVHAIRPMLWVDADGLHWQEDPLLPARLLSWAELSGAALSESHLVLFRKAGLPPVIIPRRYLNRRLEALAVSLNGILTGSGRL